MRVQLYVFPFPRVDGSEFDFSFSGMKTAAINLIHNKQQKGEPIDTENIGASYMRCVVKVLCSKTEKAMDLLKPSRFVIAGGVSANSVLRREMQALCKRKKIELFMPELRYCGDNAAMIGSQGYYEYLSGNVAGLELNAYAGMEI